MKSLKSGIYRSQLASQTEERHGGVTIRSEVYKFICIFRDRTVGYYVSHKEQYKPYFRKEFIMYLGTIRKQDELNIELVLHYDEYDQELLFIGNSNENSLNLRVINNKLEKQNEEVICFEFIDIDYVEYPKYHGTVINNRVEFIEKDKRKKKVVVYQGTDILWVESKGELVYVQQLSKPNVRGWLRREDVKFWSEP